MPADGENSNSVFGGNFRDRLELWSAALLAAATLTTAYSAYEATRWGGQQST